ncbi:MAG: hypothetical protein HY684_00785 [Chloroflexi bacterium]|nr:hypothetical protein [Chloroflexota bacterium]
MNRHRWRAVASVVAVLLTGAMAVGASTAWAHGETKIKVNPEATAPGGIITIRGEAFGKDATVTIVLEGADSRIELGSVEAHGEDGDFAVSLRVPHDAPAGRYIVRASAKDKRAEAGLTLMASGAQGPTMAEQMQELVPSRPWPQRAVLVAVALALVLGAYLLLRERPWDRSPRIKQ